MSKHNPKTSHVTGKAYTYLSKEGIPNYISIRPKEVACLKLLRGLISYHKVVTVTTPDSSGPVQAIVPDVYLDALTFAVSCVEEHMNNMNKKQPSEKEPPIDRYHILTAINALEAMAAELHEKTVAQEGYRGVHRAAFYENCLRREKDVAEALEAFKQLLSNPPDTERRV